jgi:Xaa-Pro aminopeptidase
MGLDVHDAGRYTIDGTYRPLEAGMVLTVEPGLYIAEDAAVDARFRGIGIRIEDDVLITAAGPDNLTELIPKSIADIESLVGSRGTTKL